MIKKIMDYIYSYDSGNRNMNTMNLNKMEKYIKNYLKYYFELRNACMVVKYTMTCYELNRHKLIEYVVFI